MLRSPEVGVALLCLAFVAWSAVWLYLDQGTPRANDSSRHLEAVFKFHDEMTPLYWFHFENHPFSFYPPLAYLVAAAGTIPGGLSMDGPVLALNVVFVPIYAAGCYGVAREAFGRAAGLPAAIFALAAPMAIGLSHLMLLDFPLTAMVAVSAWALLAARRFENIRLALAAGVLVGLGMLTKQLFVVYVAPVVGVLILRGGWRHWRGVASFAAAAAVVGLPWYLRHLGHLRGIADTATAGRPPGSFEAPVAATDGTGADEPGRFNLDGDWYYAWSFVNAHWYLPLTLVFLVGLLLALRSAHRARSLGYLPELVAGVLGGYLGVALLTAYQDPRYSFPSACFVAALGVGWLARARPRVRKGVTVGLLAILVLNVVSISTGALGAVKIDLPGHEPPDAVEGHLGLVADRGYSSGVPERARTLDLLEAAAADGVATISLEDSQQTADRLADLEIFTLVVAPLDYVDPTDPSIRSRRGVTLYRRSVRPVDAPPCQRFSDGTGLYALRSLSSEQQRSVDPRRAANRYCPL